EGTEAQPLLTFQPGGPVRTTEWTLRSVSVDIPADAESIGIYLVLTGSGSAWFGDLDIAAGEEVAMAPAEPLPLHTPVPSNETVGLPLIGSPALMRLPVSDRR